MKDEVDKTGHSLTVLQKGYLHANIWLLHLVRPPYAVVAGE